MSTYQSVRPLWCVHARLLPVCMYRLLAMCTTMAALITIIIAVLITTTIVARTSAHPSRRVGLLILHRATATLAGDKPSNAWS